jgi:hypothetical protein
MNIELTPTEINLDLTNNYQDAESYNACSAHHPMPNQADQPPAEEDVEPRPPSTLVYALKLLSTQLSVTVFTILLYFTTESLVNAVQNISDPARMLDAPLCRTIFYICCLGSVTSFTITSNGLTTNSNSYRHLPLLLVQSVVLLSVVLLSLVPSIHQQSPLPSRAKVGRANCSDPIDISTEFYITCPTFRPNSSFVLPTAVHVNDGTLMERNKNSFNLVKRFEGARDFFPILAKTIVDQVPDIDHVFYLKTEECIWKFIDLTCEFNFQRCNYDDCSCLFQDNATLLTCGQTTALNAWMECGKKHCLLTPGCDATTQSTVPILKRILDRAKYQVLTENQQLFDKVTTQWFQTFFGQLKDSFDKKETFQDCTGWEQSYVAHDKDRNNPNNNETSCNPKILTYEKENNKITFDSAQLLLVLNLLFLGIIGVILLLFLYETQTHAFKETHAFQSTFHLTSPRISCFFIAIIMSMLVYVGALELERAAAFNQNDTTQTVWSAVYFAASYLCFHGGIHLLILVKGTVTKTNVTKHATSSRGGRHPCSSCTEKIVVFKTEFMDANGRFFPLKLVLLEIFEMGLQMYSLLSSSQNSDAAEVTISATVLALNLMVLPVVTLLAGFIFKSTTSIVATTLITGKDLLLVLFFPCMFVMPGLHASCLYRINHVS